MASSHSSGHHLGRYVVFSELPFLSVYFSFKTWYQLKILLDVQKVFSLPGAVVSFCKERNKTQTIWFLSGSKATSAFFSSFLQKNPHSLFVTCFQKFYIETQQNKRHECDPWPLRSLGAAWVTHFLYATQKYLGYQVSLCKLLRVPGKNNFNHRTTQQNLIWGFRLFGQEVKLSCHYLVDMLVGLSFACSANNGKLPPAPM